MPRKADPSTKVKKAAASSTSKEEEKLSKKTINVDLPRNDDEAVDPDDDDIEEIFRHPSAPNSSSYSLDGTIEISSSDDELPTEDSNNKSSKTTSSKREESTSTAPSTTSTPITSFDEEQSKQKLQRLNFLLNQTGLYSKFLVDKLEAAKKESENKSETKGNTKKRAAPAKKENTITKKGKKNDGESTVVSPKKANSKEPKEEPQAFHPDQPKLVTGGPMRSYQLQGCQWLISLWENGINGILADEMGLGKTVQAISLMAHLWEKGVRGPFMVVAPLSTLGNWVREVQQWTPDIPVIKYHSVKKEEREEVRKKHLKWKNGAFPIIVTSYEIAMNDRKFLKKIAWKYIIVDEGQRLKNKHCKLIQELKKYSSSNRLLLSGTPLQNNLGELWSMLNFLLPDIFDDQESFESWFDFTAIGDKQNEQQIVAQQEKNQVVTKLHEILRPFVLRRVKSEVEIDIPKKSERIVNTSLSTLQKKYYQSVLDKKILELLGPVAQKTLKMKGGSGLKNMLMQLRKVCNHPYLLEWPTDSNEEEIIDENMVKASGKLQLLDRLLPRLKKEGHRVLIFSQMTKMMDILEDYMHLRKLRFCRLDGNTSQEDRETQMKDFNTDRGIFCFLLSTRAGGLGINLVTADTVIFYDNDWNPQMDLQAQDRCHRIGQTKPVRIYRLATANSIESRILDRQEKKMKLERLVIQKGNFSGVKSKSKINAVSDLEELLKSETPKLAGLAEDISDKYLFEWE